MALSLPGTVAVTAAALLLAGASLAAMSAADAAKARIDHMKGMGAASKAIFEQVKTGAPDMAVVKTNAAKIDAGSKDLVNWFPAGSGKEAWAKSEALPVVWSDHAGFTGKAHALAVAADKLDAVAQSGNAAAVGPAMHDVGAACKGCHETFKAKDES
jgi:cytochrome c556